MDIINFVPKELYIIIVALWIIGYIIKNTKVIRDAYIPFILLFFSIAIVFIDQGVSTKSLMQSIICSAIAVYGKNIVKQAVELFDTNENNLSNEKVKEKK